MTQRSWTEVQALAVRAATGAHVPAAQALAFGAMVPRHLADGGSDAALLDALARPDVIVTLAHRIEELIETASLSPRTVSTTEPDADRRALLVSWLASLPCQAEVTVHADKVQARLSLGAPGTRTRPERLDVGDDLFARMQTLAARTYVPDSAASRHSGAGAGLMDLD